MSCGQAYNSSRGLSEAEQKLRLDMLQDLFGSVDTSQRPFIEPPFSCDYVSARLVLLRAVSRPMHFLMQTAGAIIMLPSKGR